MLEVLFIEFKSFHFLPSHSERENLLGFIPQALLKLKILHSGRIVKNSHSYSHFQIGTFIMTIDEFGLEREDRYMNFHEFLLRDYLQSHWLTPWFEKVVIDHVISRDYKTDFKLLLSVISTASGTIVPSMRRSALIAEWMLKLKFRHVYRWNRHSQY